MHKIWGSLLNLVSFWSFSLPKYTSKNKLICVKIKITSTLHLGRYGVLRWTSSDWKWWMRSRYKKGTSWSLQGSSLLKWPTWEPSSSGRRMELKVQGLSVHSSLHLKHTNSPQDSVLIYHSSHFYYVLLANLYNLFSDYLVCCNIFLLTLRFSFIFQFPVIIIS